MQIRVRDGIGEDNMCVWRLFDRNETSDRRYLKYEITMLGELNSNVRLVLVSEHAEEVIDFSQQLRDDGTDYFTINSLDYNTTNVFLMAKKVNLKNS